MSAMWKKLQKEIPKGTKQQNKQVSPLPIQKPQLNRYLSHPEKQPSALQPKQQQQSVNFLVQSPIFQESMKINPQFIIYSSHSQNQESKYKHKSMKSENQDGIQISSLNTKKTQKLENKQEHEMKEKGEQVKIEKKKQDGKESSNIQKTFPQQQIKYDDFVDQMRQLGISIYQDSSFSNSKANIGFQIKVVNKFRFDFDAIKKQLRAVSLLKQQIVREIFRFQKYVKEVQLQWQNGLALLITKLYEKKVKEAKVLSKNEYNKIIEQLRYQILDMKTSILEKQITITKLTEELRENKIKVQQLTESIFDANQKLAQNQLRFQQQISQFIEKFKSQEKELLSEESHGQNAEDQIRRLNLEVEQLTKLYEKSQQENRKKEEKEKMMLVQEKQKMKERINLIEERQQNLLQHERNVEQAQMILREEQELLLKKKVELDNVKYLLNQKIRKIQLLEEQLEEQYYSDEGRNEKNLEGNMRIEQLQNFNGQLQKQVTSLKKKIQKYEKQSIQYARNYSKAQNFKPSNISYQQWQGQPKLKGFPKFQSLQLTNHDSTKRQVVGSTYLSPFEIDEISKHGNKDIDIYQSVKLNRSRSQQKQKQQQINLNSYTTESKEFRKQSLTRNRQDSKFMSQVISTPLQRSSIGASRPIKVRNKIMKLSEFKDRLSKIENKEKQIKKQTENKIYDKKLNELGSKIETLRNELRRQISNSKNV